MSDVLDDVHFGIDPTPPILNGKVVARFWFDEYTEFERLRNNPEINKMGCITLDEIISYGEFRKTLYAWHIKKLEIFDTPKELKEFNKHTCRYCGDENMCLYRGMCYSTIIDYNQDGSINVKSCGEKEKELTKAPQSWCYVEVKDNENDE